MYAQEPQAYLFSTERDYTEGFDLRIVLEGSLGAGL